MPGQCVRRVRRPLAGATLLAILLAAPPAATAQARADRDDDRERTFVEALRRDDPVAADRYVVLREAREKALDELRRVEAQFGAAGRELAPVFLPRIKEARRKYAESSLALLDFLDARDRQAVAGYQEAIGRITAILEERKRTRAQLEKVLRGE